MSVVLKFPAELGDFGPDLCLHLASRVFGASIKLDPSWAQIPSSIRQQKSAEFHLAMSRRAQTAQPSEVVQRPAQPSRTKTAPAAMGPSAYFRVMMFAEERDKEQEAKEFMRKVHKR